MEDETNIVCACGNKLIETCEINWNTCVSCIKEFEEGDEPEELK